MKRPTATDTAAQVDEPAQNLMVGDVDVGQQITGVFENATTALNGVTDAGIGRGGLAEAERAERQPEPSWAVWSTSCRRKASRARRSGVRALPDLEALITKVSEIPGVGDVIKPVADPMLEKLRAMTA